MSAPAVEPRPDAETIHLGLGTNLGDREANLARTAAALAEIEGLELERCSAVYDSAPIGPEQPRYLNAVIEARCALPPTKLLGKLQALEKQLGRQPGPRWSPRTIDVDILLWGGTVVAEPLLQVPHLALHQRGFALAPLCELAPSARHPVLNQTIQELLALLPDQDLQRVASFPGGW
ncbi:MAG: 2-amino-4-hydroxy-6-hydroxymethyldihydropteridine diphosphokinase [Deltaproteobacteria bacterium]|nr:2-amino-4-hydroxy-6-hydroxymethyldihydropteridine diphosphokinase [Deltaproteobacteria bacterium]